MPISSCNGCSVFKLFHICNFYTYLHIFLPDFTEKVPRLSKVEREVGGRVIVERKVIVWPQSLAQRFAKKRGLARGESYIIELKERKTQYIYIALAAA